MGGTIKLNTDIKDKLSSPASQKSCYEYSVSLNNATDGMYYIGKLNGKAAVGDRVYQKVKVPKKAGIVLTAKVSTTIRKAKERATASFTQS